MPSLICEADWKFDPGGVLTFGLRLFGTAAAMVPATSDGIAQNSLIVGTSRFRRIAAKDQLEQSVWDRRWPRVPAQMPPMQRLVGDSESAQCLRIHFLMPTAYKPRGEKQPTFDAKALAAGSWDHSIGRAKEMVQACSVRGKPLPWVEAPQVRAELVGHRLFHYEVPRHRYRQDKWIDFDGAVGYLELEGDFSAVMPWARAAEVLHFGERSTAGLGKVRVVVLD